MIKHRIALILTAIFSSLLLVSVIVLSILQSSTRPDLPNPDSIKLYLNSTSAGKTLTKGTSEYNKVMSIYNDAFEKSYLSQLTDNNILERSIHENTSAEVWNDTNTRTGVYMEFIFDEPKKYIIYRNGNSRRVDITSVIFKLTKENEFKEVDIFYEVKKETSSSSSSSSNNSTNKKVEETNYPLAVEANTSKLYNYAISNK